MTWVTAAIVSSALTGAVNIIDSHLISKRLPSLWAFLIPVGIMHLVFGAAIIGLFPLPGGIGTTPLLIAVGSAMIRTAGIILMLYAMRTEEVSRIIAVVHTFPVFVAMLAIPLLDEALSPLQWLAIFITVGGAVLISVQRGAGGRGAQLGKCFALLLASSLFMGIANIASKYALEYISFWNMYSVNAFCFGIIFIAISARPSVLRELRSMKERSLSLGLLVLNEFIVLPSIVLSYRAMELGAVSLVSTILGTRPLFVFLYALVLSRVFPAVLGERLSRGIAALKLVSIALIIGGVTIINLR